MSRTDENGRHIESLLVYLLDRPVDAKEIHAALDTSRTTYNRRRDDDDFPNAEELRLIAARFGLSATDLLVRFDLLDSDDVRRHVDSGPLVSMTKPATKRRRPSIRLRDDAPTTYP